MPNNRGLKGNRDSKTGDLLTKKQIERDKLEKREHDFYTANPQPTLELFKTEWTTQFGMPVYQDQHGARHSESTATNQLPNGKWITFSVIWPDPETGEGKYYSAKDSLDMLRKNNLVNPVNGEKIPVFDSSEEAVEYAIDRDMELNDEKHPWNHYD